MSHILDTNAKQKCMTNSTRLLSKGLLGGDPMMGSDSMMWDAKACRSSLTFIVGMMMRNDYDDDDDDDDDNSVVMRIRTDALCTAVHTYRTLYDRNLTYTVA